MILVLAPSNARKQMTQQRRHAHAGTQLLWAGEIQLLKANAQGEQPFPCRRRPNDSEGYCLRVEEPPQ